MRLDFNILWVEDQPDAVKSQRDRIDFLLRKEGFRVNAEFAISVDKARLFLGDDIFGDHVDLVLMDYDLGGGPNGSAGIEMVRDSFPFKDIVFYSADGIQKLEQSLSEGKFQGIFYSSRKDLPDTVVGVFKALVKKVLDIDHSRGIVLGATSEIDYFINQSLVTLFAKADKGLKDQSLKLVAEQLKENRKTFDKETKKVEVLTDLAALADFHHIYTSAHRLRLLRKMLETAKTHAEECKLMLRYAETMPQRNDLAHVRVVRKGFSRKLFDRNGKEITIEDMQALRVALLEHHEFFEKMMASLRPE
ncbi:MAG: hypothetical protein WA117_23635 [Verrucomicrobiia bacterium]